MFTVASTVSFVNIALTLPCCLKLMYQCIRLLDGVMSGAHGVALRLLVGPRWHVPGCSCQHCPSATC